jgi:hypothetical protein
MNISDEELDCLLRACPGLVSLEISCCDHLLNLATLPIGRYFPSLEVLYIACQSSAPGDAALVELSPRCPRLCGVSIHHSSEVTLIGVSTLATQHPQLQSLDLSSCCRVTDEYLTAIAQSCHVLDTLLLMNCAEITDAGVNALVENCPELRLLGVRGCPKVGAVTKRLLWKRNPASIMFNL